MTISDQRVALCPECEAWDRGCALCDGTGALTHDVAIREYTRRRVGRVDELEAELRSERERINRLLIFVDQPWNYGVLRDGDLDPVPSDPPPG